MDGEAPIVSKKRMRLDLPPSCLQFCPVDPAYFVVGTYNLQAENSQRTTPPDAEGNQVDVARKQQNRNGSLILFRLDDRDIRVEQTISQPSALLDLRFSPRVAGKQSILATVSSTGSLAIFGLDTSRRPALRHITTSRCEDVGEDVLFLQCNWHPSAERLIAVTTSTGLARLLQLDDEWRIKEWTDLSVQNTLEAWSINLVRSEKSDGDVQGECGQTIVYSGGDDSKLRFVPWSWDSNSSLEESHTTSPPATIKGQHNAGVTAILPLGCWALNGGRIVLTGSYDDHLRVFAIQDLDSGCAAQRVQLLSEINLGGGVWRLNLIDSSSGPPEVGRVEIRVLASCMHAGARIVSIATSDGAVWKCSIAARFEEHESMNYASDCIPFDKARGLRCISTSFYDKLLCLWEYSPLSVKDGAQQHRS